MLARGVGPTQVSALEGVHEVHVQGRKEGGLRGGAVQLQVEAEPWVRLPQLLDAVHAIEERLLALPFKTHSWMWRGHRISYAVAGCGKPVILVHGFGEPLPPFHHSSSVSLCCKSGLLETSTVCYGCRTHFPPARVR